jgi:hypothetical protein
MLKRRVDCRIKSGNEGVEDRSRDAVRTGVIVTRIKESQKTSALYTNIRQRIPPSRKGRSYC